MSARIQGWAPALHALIEARRMMPFKWGIHDCCQFARRGAVVQLGEDRSEALGLRPYRTRSAAVAQLRKLGGLAALPAKCGFDEITIFRAQRGDVMMGGGMPRTPALGICLGRHTAFPSKHGLVFINTLECERAWRVG